MVACKTSLRTLPISPSHRFGSCWPGRAAFAPASTARSASSRRRSSATARRSTCATRSSTTASSSNSSKPRARCSSTSSTRCRTTAQVVFSAHGVPKSVPAEAQRRNLTYFDATCPLVSKVHREAERHFGGGGGEARHILMIGHAGHPEVEGTMGQLPPGAMTLVQNADEARTVMPRPIRHGSPSSPRRRSRWTTPPRSSRILRARFPPIEGPQARGHLLRDHQPAGGRQGDRPGVRPGAGHRQRQFVELAAAARGRRARRARRAIVAARCRGNRLGEARRRPHPRHHRRRVGARRCWSSNCSTGSANGFAWKSRKSA